MTEEQAKGVLSKAEYWEEIKKRDFAPLHILIHELERETYRLGAAVVLDALTEQAKRIIG